VISRPELFVLLNIAWSDDELLDRIDSLANLVADGFIAVEIDGDCIVALTATATGRTKLAPMLPMTSA
jgi:hypothetical protein